MFPDVSLIIRSSTSSDLFKLCEMFRAPAGLALLTSFQQSHKKVFVETPSLGLHVVPALVMFWSQTDVGGATRVHVSLSGSQAGAQINRRVRNNMKSSCITDLL